MVSPLRIYCSAMVMSSPFSFLEMKMAWSVGSYLATVRKLNALDDSVLLPEIVVISASALSGVLERIISSASSSAVNR